MGGEEQEDNLTGIFQEWEVELETKVDDGASMLMIPLDPNCHEILRHEEESWARVVAKETKWKLSWIHAKKETVLHL